MIDDANWHTLVPEEVLKKLSTTEEGLDPAEAKKRLKIYGPNTLQTHSKETVLRIFLRQLHNPLVYGLLFATLLAAVIGKMTDAFVVLAVVLLNTLIGFVQEHRASRIIRTLSAMVPHKTTVVRSGNRRVIHSAEVVPGDIVSLEAGDKISADLRIFFVKNLQCDESTLTGESLPANKRTESLSADSLLAERKCMAFNGTYATAGVGMGIVVATGLQTEFGKISHLIEQVQPLETPLSSTLRKIAYYISLGVLIVGISLFAIGYLRGYQLFDAALAAVTLAVAAIPEGLPAIITIASAIGVQRMAKRQAIIRQLPAVEALGSTTVICTDKTGTLTHNEMTVQKIWTHAGFTVVTGAGYSFEGDFVFPKGKVQLAREEVEKLLESSILCSDASLTLTQNRWMPVGDPTEVALVIAGRKLKIEEGKLRDMRERLDAIPFESERRVMATLNLSPGGEKTIFLKGAPEEVLKTCEGNSVHLIKRTEEMAKEGMRVLAVAKKDTGLYVIEEKDIKEGFTFLGLVGMIDPPRKEVFQALQSCFRAGISIKMITGDHPITAKAIGEDLGILSETQVLTGNDLNKLDATLWKHAALYHNVFARTSPEHKLKLVEALQSSDHVVAMTGDGVNDAPALKRADIGVAMGIKGTPVAKEASDMILANDNFASIEGAVEEGRRVYDNLVKALAFVFPTSLGQALIILIAVLFFPIREGVLLHPISPIQILWVNLVVAVALALPLAFEAPEPDIMKRPPRKKKSPIFSRFILIRTFVVSFLMAFGAVCLFIWATYTGKSLAEAQTIAVTTIMLFQIFYLFNCRSLRHSVLKMGIFSNPAILIGIGIVLLSQTAFVYVPFMNYLFKSYPLSYDAWIISAGVALLIFPIIAIERWIIRR